MRDNFGDRHRNLEMYDSDLAYIHDVGFSDYVLKAAPGLLRILQRNGVNSGLVVDLGCGGGRWARVLNDRGYDVLGMDASADFIRMARANAPKSTFVTADLWRSRLPECDGVTSIGEVLNYGRRRSLAALFRRIHCALRPGGVFVFDIAGSGRIPPGGTRRVWAAGDDWAVLSESARAGNGDRLRRSVISFRKSGRHYRRREEIHEIQLYKPTHVLEALEQAGFRARKQPAFGDFRLPKGIHAFVAVKAPKPSHSTLK
jgi:SAM-dependent methyltransferase